MTHTSCSHLSDQALLAEAKRLVDHERRATVQLIALLIELDGRRLYLGEGYSSLFAYCTQALHLSEHASYTRIAAARATQRFPAILELLADGHINLTTVTLLASALTPENYVEVLQTARHRSKREVELLAATLHPRPPVPSVVRKLPAPTLLASVQVVELEASQPQTDDSLGRVKVPTAVMVPASRPAVVAPLAPERYKIQFTITRETHDKLRRVQDLLRHAIPNGDSAEIFDRALTVLLDDLARTKLAATDRPRRSGPTAQNSRHIPARVRRAVWARDAGQCTFVGKNGRRCAETGFLEVHHVVPYAAGGAATVENCRLYCAAHNKHEAALFFGHHQSATEVPEGAHHAAPPQIDPSASSGSSRASSRDESEGWGSASRERSFVRESAGSGYRPTRTRSGPSWAFETDRRRWAFALTAAVQKAPLAPIATRVAYRTRRKNSRILELPSVIQ
jgi:hypothetical protein